MDLDFSPEEEAFRAEARAWLAAHVPRAPLPSLETREGFAEHRAWERALHAGGWSAVSWPPAYGGRGRSFLEWLVFEEEYWAAGAPARVSQNGIGLLAPTLFEHGTEEQRARVLPAMASGETVWAQAWSEPGAGSDLASLRSVAVPAPGGWLLSGQKAWSSRAAFADRAFGLFRSRPVGGGRPHEGLTYAMFGLDAQGVTVRPVARLDGRPAFAEIFLDEVFVPERDVVGAPGDGWRVAMSTAGSERGLTLRSPGRYVAAARRLVALWRAAADPGDTALRDRVADAVVRARAYQLYGYGCASAPGGPRGAEPSLTKLFWSELDLALHETALDLLAAYGELAGAAADAPAHGAWAEGWVFALAGPVYAGTNEIQRDIVAERLLGLPRGRRAPGGAAAPRERPGDGRGRERPA